MSVKQGKPKQLSRAVARIVLKTVDAGLVKGVGNPIPGQMCIEAAVCFALGQPHGDEPQCVGRAVRAYKIKLNDAAWSSDKARAKGMRRVAIAQLGSDQINQNEFRKLVVVDTVKKILPIALRAAASMVSAHKDALEVAAVACEAILTFAEASPLALKAKAAADAAYAAAAYAAAATAAAAYAAAAATADAAYAAAATAAAAYAAAATAAAAYAAAATADAAAAAAATAAAKKRDLILSIAAEIAVDALKKLKCQGTKWLDLCDKKAA